MLVKNKEIENASFCTGKYQDLFGIKHYHTFLVKDNLALDPAQNVASNFEKYVSLLNFEIILLQDAEEVVEEINYLDKNNKDFKKSNAVDVLKIAMYKEHMKNK